MGSEAVELREYDWEELWSQLGEGRREVLNLRFQLATGQLTDYSKLRAAKRRVARLLTVIREIEIASEWEEAMEGGEPAALPTARHTRQEGERLAAEAAVRYGPPAGAPSPGAGAAEGQAAEGVGEGSGEVGAAIEAETSAEDAGEAGEAGDVEDAGEVSEEGEAQEDGQGDGGEDR